MIDLLNLKDLNEPFQVDIRKAMIRVASSGRYILGPEVEAFEREWAEYCGVEYCVGTGNCLDALKIILMAHGIGRGDEVIVPANTYIATWLAVSEVGARPIPVDASPYSRNIDTEQVSAAITGRTAAILATHLYGLPASMTPLRAIAERRGILLFADAAQAHGAVYGGRKVGGLCDAEAFSFYPSKNLGALGDGGCITTEDSALAERARRLRNYGGVGRLDHTVRGINSRLDEVQAAILRAKLPHLDAMNERRKRRASFYSAALRNSVTVPQWGGNWHQYVIEAKRRPAVIERLREFGVDAHVHYPVPPYLEPAYEDMGIKRGTFPVTERLADEVLSLPIGNDVDITRVARAALQAVGAVEMVEASA